MRGLDWMKSLDVARIEFTVEKWSLRG